MTHTKTFRNFDCYTVGVSATTKEELLTEIAKYKDCTVKHKPALFGDLWEAMMENKNLCPLGGPKPQ